MSNSGQSQNESCWEKLFEKYSIVEHVNTNGTFTISAAQIKEFREPRLMTKFDHTSNLPKLFSDNKLAILPITRGDYVIARFDAYQKFDGCGTTSVKRFSLPEHIQSLDITNITSESVALNCALASGVFADFLDDSNLFATVSGRMGTGVFDFKITDVENCATLNINVRNSQMEIDAAYESSRALAVIEAKRNLADDFLIRQLYYPYRVWQARLKKKVRPIYMVYSNGIFHLYEYEFQNAEDYNSLLLIKQGNYSVDDTVITRDDINSVLCSIYTEDEPELPFPQADKFERIINLCELLDERELSAVEITEQYAFDARQTKYYTDAGRYLGLIEKNNSEGKFSLSVRGKNILGLNFKQRQLEYCKLILAHKPFLKVLQAYFKNNLMPDKGKIVDIMKKSGLYNISSGSTFERRASTVKSWVSWITDLIK